MMPPDPVKKQGNAGDCFDNRQADGHNGKKGFGYKIIGRDRGCKGLGIEELDNTAVNEKSGQSASGNSIRPAIGEALLRCIFHVMKSRFMAHESSPLYAKISWFVTFSFVVCFFDKIV